MIEFSVYSISYFLKELSTTKVESNELFIDKNVKFGRVPVKFDQFYGKYKKYSLTNLTIKKKKQVFRPAFD